MPSPITFGYACDIGKVRKHQEDAVYTFFAGGNNIHPDFGLFIVCDGMGWSGIGAKAAALAIEQLALKIQRKIYIPLRNGEKVSADKITKKLVEGVRQGNNAILETAKSVTDFFGGTCLTAAVVVDKTAYIAHVGDTRCYAVQPEKLDQLTIDHTFVEELIRRGIITREEANDHPRRDVLYRALGQASELEVDTHKQTFEPECALLLCSDGISRFSPKEEILQTIRVSQSPQHACDNLIALANERGGYDNSAVIIVSNEFPFAGQS